MLIVKYIQCRTSYKYTEMYDSDVILLLFPIHFLFSVALFNVLLLLLLPRFTETSAVMLVIVILLCFDSMGWWLRNISAISDLKDILEILVAAATVAWFKGSLLVWYLHDWCCSGWPYHAEVSQRVQGDWVSKAGRPDQLWPVDVSSSDWYQPRPRPASTSYTAWWRCARQQESGTVRRSWSEVLSCRYVVLVAFFVCKTITCFGALPEIKS